MTAAVVKYLDTVLSSIRQSMTHTTAAAGAATATTTTKTTTYRAVNDS